MIVIVITTVIGILGLFLLIILFLRLRRVLKDQKLKKLHQKDEGLADLLIYASVIDDGIILGKNGALMAAWIYQGADEESSTEKEKEFTTMAINKAFIPLGNGWMIHIDAIRKPAPGYTQREFSHFPDPLSFSIDEERRTYFDSHGTLYEGYFILTLTYFPPAITEKKFAELMFDDDNKEKSSGTQKIIDNFKEQIETFQSRLSIALKLSRLKGITHITEDGKKITQDDFLSWLQFCVTGLSHPVNLPNCPMYIDKLIGGQELYTGITPLIGQHFIRTVSIDGFPMESYPGMLSILAELPIEYRWSSRFILMDQHEALTHIEKYRKKWNQKVRGFFEQIFQTNKGKINQDALDMVQDADQALRETHSGLVTQGYYTSVLVLMGKSRDELERISLDVAKQINSLGFTARIETVNTMEAFLGSLPGHGVENIRRPILNTLNFADLIPTSTIWTGLNYAPCDKYPPNSPALMSCITHGRTPFRLNLHVRDVGHTLIFGPTGAGKSTLLALLAAQLLRYEGMTIFSFDKGMSMFPLVNACGGKHYEVGGEEKEKGFCPLRHIDSASDRAWAAEWIDNILLLNDFKTTPEQRNRISECLQILSKESVSRTLSEFSIMLQDQNMREAIKNYTIEGDMGWLFDSSSDSLNLESEGSYFSVFEIEDLMNLGNKYALPALLYLFRRIEKSLKGQPAVIILDEAWLMLGHPVFREKIREWLKVLRKANCIVIMATQSLSDIANSGILDVIKESTATKIFLPNIYAGEEESRPMYIAMGMNDRQIEIIRTAIPKRQYYFSSEQGRRLFELAIGELTMSFVGASSKDDIQQIKLLIQQYGSDWPWEWLKLRNVDISFLN